MERTSTVKHIIKMTLLASAKNQTTVNKVTKQIVKLENKVVDEELTSETLYEAILMGVPR